MSLREWLRKKREPAPAPAGGCRSKSSGALPSLPAGIALAQNLGEIWRSLDMIAREDGLTERSAVEHYNLTAEGKKDVERWFAIYLRRAGRAAAVVLPIFLRAARTHRGHWLLPRVWPDGLRWAAINQETLLCAPVGETPDRASLASALDQFLDGAIPARRG